MHTIVKAVLAAGIATSGASYLVLSAPDPRDQALCQAALEQRDRGRSEGFRIADISVAAAGPGSYRGTVESTTAGPDGPERRRFTCRIADGQATVVVLSGRL